MPIHELGHKEIQAWKVGRTWALKTGFHSWSRMIMWQAATRLIPSAPAFVLRSSTCKAMKAAFREIDKILIERIL